MKKLLIAAMAIAATVGVAEAKCSVASLNGDWVVMGGPADEKEHTAAGGVIDLGGGTSLTILKFGSKCVGLAKYKDGTDSWIGTVSSEMVTGTRKPNILKFAIPSTGGGSGYEIITAFRN